MNLRALVFFLSVVAFGGFGFAAEEGAKSKSASAGEEVISAFESKSWEGWSTTGEAFGPGPFVSGEKSRFTEFVGAGLAWSGRGGVEGKGTLVSTEFPIQRKFINFLIAGARDLPSVLGAELLVDGCVVRAVSASEVKDPSRALYWRTWNVRELIGRTARIRVNDRSATGSVAVDQFTQSDEPKGVPSDATNLGAESHRPQFHFTAEIGWLNDANGLLHYKSQWHLFHQHRPPGGAVVWGHATSGDLLHWKRRPIAVASGDEDGAFSGSGLVDWDNASGLKRGDDSPILLFYTRMPPSNSDRKGTQCFAFSTDGGKTFEQFPGNPILRTPATRDRDPKVFFHKPTRAWIMALSLSRDNTDRDHATYGLFRSKDLKTWELFQELGPGSWYWECPDMFELPVDGDAARTKWVFMKGSGDYILGTFDGQHFTPETEPIRTHWGGNFYGSQTFNDAPSGRRVHIGWMSTGKDAANSWPGMPFNQQMSFPRELSLRTTPQGPRLFREPIAEIAQLYTKTHELKRRELKPGENALADIHGELLDLEITIELKTAKQVTLNLRGTEMVYDVKNGKLKAFGRSLTLAPINGQLVLRGLLDRTSIELFGNQGDFTLSGVFFADPANQNLALTVDGGSAHVHRLVARELKSIWPPIARVKERNQ